MDKWPPWGIHEIAAYLDVDPGTVSQWKHRGQLPEPDGATKRQDLWWPTTIRDWANGRND